jgi:murein L,D-transpeptidase YafK
MKVAAYHSLVFFFVIMTCVCGCVPFLEVPTQYTVNNLRLDRSIRGLNGGVPKDRWLLVEGKKRTLSVMEGYAVKKIFSGLSFGSGGIRHKARKGDGVTPVGQYRIGWLNPNSRFKLFFGLNYPNGNDADRAVADGTISRNEASYIKSLERFHRTPPQNTRLGGMVGIHGVGMGDLAVHHALNWTDGCVALDNEQIDELYRWISIGMMVEIRP